MRKSWLVLVVCCAFACGKGAIDLKVVGTPVGLVLGKMHVIVSFSKPMVAPDAVGKPAVAPPIKIEPALPGAIQWTDPKTLVFDPSAALPISTKYTVTIPKDTAAIDGNHLGDDVTFEFFTERLTASFDVLGDDKHATKDQRVRLVLNQPVALDQVTSHCKFTAGDKTVKVKNGPQSPSGPAKSYTLVPDGELALDTDWKIGCDTEMHGTVGNVGLEKPAELALRTYGALKFVKIDPSAKDIVPDEGLEFTFEFTNSLKEPFLVSINPPVQGFPQDCHENGGDHPGLSCTAPLEAQTNYTVTVDGKQQDDYGQTLGKTETFQFHTTDAKPSLSLETGYFLAELKRPIVPVWTRNVSNVQVTTVPVTPDNFHQIRPLLSWWDSKPADFSKTTLQPVTKTISVAGTRNKWAQHPLGAADLLPGAVAGPGMYYLELTSNEVKSDALADGGREKVLVNFTDIGVVSKISSTRSLVWATRLSTGKPLPGATVTVRDDVGKVKFTATTDADGVAILPGQQALIGKKPAAVAHAAPTDGSLDPNGEHYSQEQGGAAAAPAQPGVSTGNFDDFRIFVSTKDDFTMVAPTKSNGLSSWSFGVSVDDGDTPYRLRGFMHTDRGLYRPGEKVHIKGLARTSKLAQPLEVPKAGTPVAVTVTNPKGKQMTTMNVKLSDFGGFWFDLDIPGDATLGDYSISAQIGPGTFTRDFTVEEYRPATFEVTGSPKDGKLVREGSLHAAIAANYFYGSPVRDADVKVTVHSRTRAVDFQGFDDYRFGDDRRFDGYYSESDQTQALVTENAAKLDDKGNGKIEIPITTNDVAHDADLLITASVSSPTNEVETKSFTVPYFASRTYYGVKSDGYFLDVAKPAHLSIVALDPDGKPMKSAAKVTVVRRDWNCVWEDWGYRGNYNCTEAPVTVLTKQVPVDASGKPADVAFTPDKGGDYWVTVEGADAKQEASATSFEIYAWGDGGGSWKSSDSMTFDIVSDKKEYKSGDTATLLLKTDLTQATGLVTIERDGVIEKRIVQITPKVKHVQIPIVASYAPNVYVSVALVQGRIGDGTRGKPVMRMGVIDLPVRPEDNKLTVTITTDKPDYRPGETVTATVNVTDAAGKPASSEVSITAADEGVLSLLGYKTPDPIPTFFASWGLGVSTATQLEYLRDIPGADQDRPALGGDALGTVRSHFVSTAVWTPNAITDATGTATVTFTAPDNLTAFRVMVLAADKGHKFGSADKRFTVSKPLQLMSSLPRFIDMGDQLKGGVVVHNDTGRAGTATVTMAIDSHLATTAPLTQTVDVPKDARVPVLWPITGAVLGDSTIRFSVQMDSDNDAVELKLPVHTAAPSRIAMVATGSTTDAKTIDVPMPAGTEPNTAELIVSVDRDGLAGIEQGLADLIHYPYGCLEQTTSQVIPMLAAKDLADSLQLEGLTGPALDGYIKAGITKIGLHQTQYGGYSLWPGGDPDAYLTAYALWGLSLAKKAGYTVDQSRIDDGLEYLKNDGKNPDASRPHYYGGGDLGSQAFAVYIRASLGDKSAAADATALVPKAGAMPIYGKAFLARALAASLGKSDPQVHLLVTDLTQTALAANKKNELIAEPDEVHLWSYMSSSERTTAIVLGALVDIDPKNAAIGPLVRELMRYRNKPNYYYGDTQSDLYSIVSLSAYAQSRSASNGSSVAVSLGGQSILAGAFSGKQRIRAVTLPMAAAGQLSIQPTGEVYYHVAVRYRQTLAALKPEANGLLLAVEYLDEAGKKKTSYTVGDVVRVRVTTTVKNDADHMIVSVGLPAGFEAINTKFVTGVPTEVTQSTEWGTFQEMHDERVDFASEYSSAAIYTHEFLIRATSVGSFVRPPTVAQLMYQPATTARTGADTLEIKAK